MDTWRRLFKDICVFYEFIAHHRPRWPVKIGSWALLSLLLGPIFFNNEVILGGAGWILAEVRFARDWTKCFTSTNISAFLLPCGRTNFWNHIAIDSEFITATSFCKLADHLSWRQSVNDWGRSRRQAGTSLSLKSFSTRLNKRLSGSNSTHACRLWSLCCFNRWKETCILHIVNYNKNN